jgi:hypothetical protein
MSNTLHRSLAILFRELIDGSGSDAAWMLNPEDVGLLRSVAELTASAASTVPPAGGATIAAHVDHVHYGLALMNRWSRGDENPWSSADWTASWKRVVVNDQEWAALRAALEAEARTWLDTLRTTRDVSEFELNGVIGSVAHLAYHFGAIRQIDRSIRGPAAG